MESVGCTLVGWAPPHNRQTSPPLRTLIASFTLMPLPLPPHKQHSTQPCPSWPRSGTGSERPTPGWWWESSTTTVRLAVLPAGLAACLALAGSLLLLPPVIVADVLLSMPSLSPVCLPQDARACSDGLGVLACGDPFHRS